MLKQLLFGLGCIAAGYAAAPLQARNAELRIAEMDAGLWRVAGLQMELADGTTQSGPTLRLRMNKLALPDVGMAWNDIDWRCAVVRKNLAEWRCAGNLSWRLGTASGTRRSNAALDLGISREWLDLQWQRESASLSARLALGDDAVPIRLDAVRLPLLGLDDALHLIWSAGKLSGGTLSAQFELLRDARGVLSSASGEWRVAALAFDSTDGLMAGAGLEAEGRLSLSLVDQTSRFDLAARFNGGEFLAGPLYVALPTTPVDVAAKFDLGADGSLRVERLQLDDAGTLRASIAAELSAAPGNRLLRLEVSEFDARLPGAYERYAKSWLATRNLGELQTSGSVAGTIALQDARPAAYDLSFRDLAIADNAGRFALSGVQGGLAWNALGDLPERELRWASASLYGLPVAAGVAFAESRAGRLQLARPLALQLLDGSLEFDALGWRPGTGGDEFGATLKLNGLSVAKLSRELGWPEFGGTLSGHIPGVTYANEVFSMSGGLELGVFDGRVAVSGLAMERPFGVAPTMSADIIFSNLDLKLLTGAFSFGEIQGRLEGSVSGLRLVDWSPVRFDADLHTAAKDKGPRRISQRAVNGLSSVGGSGLVAGLQASVLRAFDTFGYDQIGLKCRLENNVCRMDGLDSAGSGYHIVKGAGIPRISVIGHERRVNWPVLVKRLKATTAGASPIVR